jgi:hypothetical protein
MPFSQVQRVSIVKHYPTSRSYLTWQNEFRDTFSDSLVPKKSTMSRLVNCFHDIGSMQDRNCSGQSSVLSDDSLDKCMHECSRHFQHFIKHCFLFSDFSVIYVLTNRTCVRNGFHNFSVSLYNSQNLPIHSTKHLYVKYINYLVSHK